VALGSLILLAACDDSFEAPPQPDLHKAPYDFAMSVGPQNDLAVPDLFQATDLPNLDH
jgi:hypothetical protein